MKTLSVITKSAILVLFCALFANCAYETPLSSKLIELLRRKPGPIEEEFLLEGRTQKEEEPLLEEYGKKEKPLNKEEPSKKNEPLMQQELLKEEPAKVDIQPLTFDEGEKKGFYNIQPLQIQTIVRTETKFDEVTVTDFPTCTVASPANQVPLCQYNQRSRAGRSLISSSRSPHVPRPSKVTPEMTTLEVVPSFPFKQSEDEPSPTSTDVLAVPQAKVIVVEVTSLLRSIVTKTALNSETTVGISYSGCIPADAIKTTACP